MSSAELKAQGNALFSAKNYTEAGDKYSAAIAASDDPKGLAVLYANRAACRLSLKRYMDADADARKATQLDPTYAKAFARLATAEDAMGQYPKAQQSWQRALDALPKANLTPAEGVQKVQYQAGLEAAAAGVAKLQATPIVGARAVGVQGGGRLPWELAAAMLPRLRLARPVNGDDVYSSAWVIASAYEDFSSGVNKMSQLKFDEAAQYARGIPHAVADLTNGIIRDARVIHFTDSEFISKYNRQMGYEIEICKPWLEAGPEEVVREAPKRQREQGWVAARRAVSLTIRTWIMRAVMDAALRQRHDVAVELFKRALDVLRSLRAEWASVPPVDRGVVFEKTFLFGIQRLYIDSIMQAYALNPDPELLEALATESDVLISEVDAALREPRAQPPRDPGFVLSFYLYPRGLAYAMKGFYYNTKAGLSSNDAREFCRKAAVAYIQAADAFPEDDEQHPWFLNAALGNMFTAHAFPLRETLEVMQRIRLSAPKAKAIWERSSLSANGLWGILEGVGRRETELRGRVARGEVGVDEVVGAAGL
ncbi:hypothetical protein B0H17DRAFT_1191859 [Mycena rosella]|uniref:TPR-like protein n=1 Tax=Mycena rosella TaxID=1033263 RepID=A0AAD7M9W6_MYCRO|nr:hypothetical protein B0H17DRAFT_1191859 [Mycena rosella]